MAVLQRELTIGQVPNNAISPIPDEVDLRFLCNPTRQSFLARDLLPDWQVTLPLVSVSKEDEMSNVAKNVKSTIDKTATAAKNATDKAADAAGKAAVNTGNAVKNAGQKIKDAGK